ncbi:AraC family transcriptional regulator [Gordonia soli]|uniref:Putative AraC family transcriptional regulator n=1 Tax=Gordonia soli NBRC 108243 TaxID=1223545 RepID=M0QRS1_9ACTN|nr:helix-turn-helix transcriptional regulator [Gordonia soli]GAC70292.1 putative AraC family transcriptional regulator [Gordonia soli NBRC 108243]
MITVRGPAEGWTVPADRAAWIPADSDVVIENTRSVSVRVLYFHRTVATPPTLDNGVRVIALSSFGRELRDHIVARAPLHHGDAVSEALTTLVVDQIVEARDASLGLPLLTSAIGVAFAAAVAENPAAPVTEIARALAVSVRTLERAVLTETGLGAGAWRRRARILTSIDALVATRSVTEAAVASGYSTPSAYVAAFSGELGSTPRRHLLSDR